MQVTQSSTDTPNTAEKTGSMLTPLMPVDICLVVDAKTPDITPLIESLYRQENIDLSQCILYLHVRGKRAIMQDIISEIQQDYASHFLGIAVTYVSPKLSESATINRLVRECSSRHLLLLDSQSYLDPHAIWQLQLSLQSSEPRTLLWQAANSAQPNPLIYDPLNLHLPYASPGCLLMDREYFQEAQGLDPKLHVAAALADLSIRMKHLGLHTRYVPRAGYYNDAIIHPSARDMEDGLKLRIRYGTWRERLKGLLFWHRQFKDKTITRKGLFVSLFKMLWHYRYFHHFPRELLKESLPFHGWHYAPSLPQPAQTKNEQTCSISTAPVGIIPPEPLDEDEVKIIRHLIANQSHPACQLVTREHVKAKPDACEYYLFLESGYQFYPQHVENLLSLAEKRKARLAFCHGYDLKEGHILSGRSRLPLGCYLLRKDMIEKFLDQKDEAIRSKLAYIPAAETAEISIIHLD